MARKIPALPADRISAARPHSQDDRQPASESSSAIRASQNHSPRAENSAARQDRAKKLQLLPATNTKSILRTKLMLCWRCFPTPQIIFCVLRRPPNPREFAAIRRQAFYLPEFLLCSPEFLANPLRSISAKPKGSSGKDARPVPPPN